MQDSVIYNVSVIIWTKCNCKFSATSLFCSKSTHSLQYSPTASLLECTSSDRRAPASSRSITSTPSFSAASSHRTPVATRWMLSLFEYSSYQQPSAPMHIHTHNHCTALWILSWTTRLSQYQKKHSPTHTYRGHQSSLICLLHLLRSMASSLFNLHAWQSFSTISLSKISLVCLLVWHPPLHTPYHHILFCCSTETVI